MRIADNIGIIVQARMGSRRFPGKVLAPLAGKPMVQYLLERLQHCRTCARIVVAVPDGADDRVLAEFCRGLGVDVYQGAAEDVARRFLEAVHHYAFDGFVRVCADSPLLDPQLIDWAVNTYMGRQVDIVTNLMVRSYPKGQSVEVLNAAVFESACLLMESPQHREHVTTYFYENRNRFSMLNLAASCDHSKLDLSVDSREDLKRLETLIQQFERPHWMYGLDDLVDMCLETIARPIQDVA